MTTVPSPPAGVPPPPGAPAPFPFDYAVPPFDEQVLTGRDAYRSLRGMATLVLALLTMMAVALGVSAAMNPANTAMLDRIRDGAAGDREIASWALRAMLGGFSTSMLWLATGVAFVAWFHRAYVNLAALGAPRRRFGTGYAVGSWFVPFMNLFRPKQIADDIWRHSEPDALLDGMAEPRPRAMLPVHVWWGLFLTFSIWTQAVGFAGTGGADLTQPIDRAGLRTGMAIEGVGRVVGVLAAGAAILFVYQVTVRQAARAAKRFADASLDRKPARAGPVVAALLTLAVIALLLLATRPAALTDEAVETFAPLAESLFGGDPGPTLGLAPPDEEPAGAPEVGADARLGSRPMDELGIGDCFEDPEGDDMRAEVELIACAAPHMNEVYALLELPDGPEVPYAENRILEDSDGACVDAFEDYVGTSYEESELIIWTMFFPDEALWEAGDRAVGCALSDIDLEPLEGSMAGTER